MGAAVDKERHTFVLPVFCWSWWNFGHDESTRTGGSVKLQVGVVEPPPHAASIHGSATASTT